MVLFKVHLCHGSVNAAYEIQVNVIVDSGLIKLLRLKRLKKGDEFRIDIRLIALDHHNLPLTLDKLLAQLNGSPIVVVDVEESFKKRVVLVKGDATASLKVIIHPVNKSPQC